ncbi:SdrD B-like domain-containing protein [Undibacterium sp. TJN25]|uniref:SdrD B-like domain-containing protein n=1 Tax=Undibacterium sp. TJN25 TaxID=3413056 RepID=UPI003BF0354A
MNAISFLLHKIRSSFPSKFAARRDSRAGVPRSRIAKPTLGAGAMLLSAALGVSVSANSYAQVVATSVTSATDLGRNQIVAVNVDWSRITTGAGDKITVTIPAELTANPPAPPAGCVYTAPSMVCDVPDGTAGDGGTITFQVKGFALGGFNLNATGTSPPAATFSGTVNSTGDVTIGKTKSSPAGNPVAGATTVFTLTPQIASGDDVPTGGSMVVVDNLPGTSADYGLNSVTFTGITPSCNSASSANGSRTLTCTYAGPFTVAALNASSIIVSGAPGNNGAFANTASISSANNKYFDSNNGNNTVTVNYTVDPGTDVQALGSFPSAAQIVSTSQPLSITYKNNGPLVSIAGGIVETIVPASFTIGALPAGCTSTAAQSRTVSGTTYNGTLVSCTAAAVSIAAGQSFSIPLTMPSAAEASSFPVLVTPPPGMGDANLGNNTLLLPYQIVNPFADLRASKSKTPGGPQPSGTSVTSTLTITNDAASPSAAAYSAGQPLRIVDFARPEEVSGGTVSGVTAGWTCSVATGITPPAFAGDSNRTTRITCSNVGPGSLAVGASTSVSFTSTIAAVASPIELTNRACTGSQALAALSLADTAGPQPPDGGRTGNDCADAGSGLIATPVVSGNAQVSIKKESSVDNTTYFDAVGSAPTLLGGANTLYWRMTVTTPTVGANAAQQTIPTLLLTDTLPGIVNVTSTGAPAPDFKTPAIIVTTTPSTFGSCPNIAAGDNGLTCSFSNVPAGTTIIVDVPVSRALTGGILSNTATLTSPNAILSAPAGGQLNDAAAVNVVPRVDVALTTKTVTPTTPSVGQIVQFNITAENLGVADITGAGQFTITDTLFTGTPTLSTVAYEVVSVTPSNAAKMSCAASNLSTGAISCTNTAQINRYETQTIVISARIKKPTGIVSAANSILYTGVTNTASVVLDSSYCEFRTETSTVPVSTSTACNDAAATSNNSKTATFDVKVPAIDLQQGKVRVLPVGQTSFAIGDQLRYRFSIRNAGPSRAEGVIMTDVLTIPAGFHLAMASAMPDNINGAAASAGFTLDSKAVTCMQASQDQAVTCQLDATVANDFLDAGKEVNFEIAMNMTGTSSSPIVFGNAAHVCADETNTYESSGKCSADPAIAGNNLAAVNDVIFPKTDLEVVSKTRITASPVDINQPVQYQIVVRNNGGSSTTGMRVKDFLPPNFEFLTGTVNGVNYTPTVVKGSFAGLALDAGTPITCAASPASLTATGQSQTVSCDLLGTFPGNNGATNVLTLTLYARAKYDIFTGPFLTDRQNQATVEPGKDSTGTDISIDPIPGNSDNTNTNGRAQTQVKDASLGGRTFADLNNNGIQNGTAAGQDEGIGGVTITLTGTDLYGNAISKSVTSNGATGATKGDYLFDGLPPSSTGAANGYTVTQTQPAGFLINGTPQPGTGTASAGTASNNNGTSPVLSLISNVNLASAQNGISFNFPEPGGSALELSGFVYADTNNNGVKDGGEAGILGVVMTLSGYGFGANGVDDNGGGDDLPVSNATVASSTTATTDSSGKYTFVLLQTGKYTVTEQTAQPAVGGVTTLRGITTPGTAAGGTQGCVETATACIVPTGVAPSPATAGQGETLTTVTQELAGAGTASAIKYILPSSGNSSLNNNFGEVLPGSIAGFVFKERTPGNPTPVPNQNYQPGTDAPFGGVTLTLSGTDDLGNAVSATQISSGTGAYLFAGLRPGTYTVTETQPAGIVSATPGAFAGKDQGATVRGTVSSSEIIGSIAIAAGRQVTDTNFAEISNDPPAVLVQVSGKVWIDNDSSQTQSSTEKNLSNIFGSDSASTLYAGDLVVRITDSVGAVQLVAVAADGTYHASVPPGAVTVQVVGPANYSNTTNNQSQNLAAAVGAGPTSCPAPIGSQPANNFCPIGYRPPSGNIIGHVFFDDNKDRNQNGSEPNYSGTSITVKLLNPDGTPVLGGDGKPVTAVVDANGDYTFTNIPVGNYLTQLAGPGNITQTTPGTEAQNIIVTSGQTTGRCPAYVTPGAKAACVVDTGYARSSPDLVVTKSTAKATFTEGYTATYTLSVANAGSQPTAGSYTVTDRLAVTAAPQKWAINAASGNGWICTISADRISVACDSTLVLQPGQSNPNAISLAVDIRSGAQAASPVRNVVSVAGGGESPSTQPTSGELANPPLCAATPQANVCHVDTPIQFAAGLSGSVWLDGGMLKKGLDGGDKLLPSWTVELYDMSNPANATRSFSDIIRSGPTVSTTTNSNGFYQFLNLEPGSVYRVVFRDPASRIVFPGVVTNNEGTTTGADYFSQVVTRDGYQVLEVRLPVPRSAGQITAPEQSLPIDPNGVVYDSTTRLPVPGAIVAFVPTDICAGYSPQQHVINYESYAKDAQGNPEMTVGSDGFYKFLLSGDPTAPANCKFSLVVTPPAGYLPAPSGIIKPSSPLMTPPAPGVLEVQPQKTPPTGTQSTTYYLTLQAGRQDQEIVNNHIPLDPYSGSNLAITKIGSTDVVELGDSLLYTIQVFNRGAVIAAKTTVIDSMPAGFRYIAGSYRLNNVAKADPAGGAGPVLQFAVGDIPAASSITLTYRARVAVGAQQGDGINRAQAVSGNASSGEARWKVRVTGGVFTDDACILGKIFVDCNGNHIQDKEELGIPGVRLYMEDGTSLISDSEGKYSICGVSPRTHVLKVDKLTLPRGSRLTTSSSRNAGDANSLFVDLQNGELHRADFIEGSCSNTVLEQVKARRGQGEVSVPQTEKKQTPGLRFESKGRMAPQEATDSANQQAVKPRYAVPPDGPPLPEPIRRSEHEQDVPTPLLPMLLPASQAQGGAHVGK